MPTGPTHNPHRHGWSAGGSSSGSAVAVATGEADMALGADQAGSIRMPASFSGVVGLKPTYSLVPYTGIAPIEAVIDHVGPMTRTVADNARLLQVIAGSDGIDPRQRDVRVGDYTADLDAGVRGVRIGVLREGFGQPGGEPDVDAQVRQAVTVLEKLGATVTEVSIPLHLLGPALWTPIADRGPDRDRAAQPGLRHQPRRLLPGRHDGAPAPPPRATSTCCRPTSSCSRCSAATSTRPSGARTTARR